jgi:hypothetical protein
MHLFTWVVLICRPRWSRGLRRSSAAARLLGLWVRTPPGTWTYVVCIRVLSDRGLCDVPIHPPEESFRVCVTECDQM